MNDVELILQGFEWSMQLFLMMFQNKKTLSAILGHMSNKETYDRFNRRQFVIMGLNYSLVAMLVIAYAAIIYALFTSEYKIDIDIIIIKNFVLLAYLSSVGLAMLYNMKYKYNYEYKK